MCSYRQHQSDLWTGEDASEGGSLLLSRAVEGDDWSSVIDGQTAETIADGGNPVQDTNQYPIATPFARASVHRSIGEPHSINSQSDSLHSQSVHLSEPFERHKDGQFALRPLAHAAANMRLFEGPITSQNRCVVTAARSRSESETVPQQSSY